MYLEKSVLKNEIKENFKKEFKYALFNLKRQRKFNKITFLCVGTDRIIGDSLGPFVGSKLEILFAENNYYNINVFGTLQKNMTYQNILPVINNLDFTTGIVVVDAALSKKEEIGNIYVSNNKTTLGKGLSKNNIKIGDISIKTAVAKNFKIPYRNFKSLQKTSLNKIIELSDIVSDGIFEVIKKYY